MTALGKLNLGIAWIGIIQFLCGVLDKETSLKRSR